MGLAIVTKISGVHGFAKGVWKSNNIDFTLSKIEIVLNMVKDYMFQVHYVLVTFS